MKFLKNNEGIALVTALMLTLITLGISMVMLYMVLQNTQLSGAQKRYKNSLDAASGAVEIVTTEALPYLLSFAGDATPLLTNLQASMATLTDASHNFVTGNDLCLKSKLTKKNAAWAGDCVAASKTSDAKELPDIAFTLQSGIAGGFTSTPGFRVYAKIVSTTVGSSDMSGRRLENVRTDGGAPSDIGMPYLYRIEVSGERVSNPRERANLSVLYAF